MTGRTVVALMLVLAARSGAQGMAVASDAEAQRLQGAGMVEPARDMFERVLLRDATDAAAQDGMAATSERIALDARVAGHMDEALAALLRAQKIEPHNKRVLLDLGIVEEEMNLHLDAAATLKTLESLPPIEPNAYYAEARTDISLGRLTEAEDKMQAYLRVQPLDASAHFGLGRVYELGLKFDQASAEFRRSIELQPKQTEAYYEAGQVDLNTNQLEEAERFFTTALDRSPAHGGALTGMGIVSFKLKRFQAAKDWLLRAEKVAPDYQPVHYYLGLTMARLGETAGSRKELDVATALAAKDSKEAASRTRLNPGEQP